MSSDCMEAGLSLCGRSVLVSVAAILRVVVNVTVVAVGSGTATLLQIGGRDFLY